MDGLLPFPATPLTFNLLHNSFATELAKFFDGNALHPRRDLQRHGSGRDYGHDDGDDRGRDRYHLLQRLAGICTFHNSSALDPTGFQLPVPVKQRTAGDEGPFLADRSWQYLGIAAAVGR